MPSFRQLINCCAEPSAIQWRGWMHCWGFRPRSFYLSTLAVQEGFTRLPKCTEREQLGVRWRIKKVELVKKWQITAEMSTLWRWNISRSAGKSWQWNISPSSHGFHLVLHLDFLFLAAICWLKYTEHTVVRAFDWLCSKATKLTPVRKSHCHSVHLRG